MNPDLQSKTSSAGAAALRPTLGRAVAVVDAPGDGPGFWAGAPSALLVDGVYYLAYRLRRPVGEGRGYAVVVARSDDGVKFESVVELARDDFDSASLERPALVRTGDGRWRLYVSSATPGTLHWRVEVLEAGDPSGFSARDRHMVLPGDEHTAVKDPVVLWSDGQWHLWASCHPLPDPAEADRMETRYATSDDGLAWTWRSTALVGRAGAWDERGVRITSVIRDGDRSIAFYDGRATAAENTEERSGLAIGDGQAFAAATDEPIGVSPYGTGSLRYLSAVALGDGGYRLFYEATDPNGAHSLYAEHVETTG